MAQTLLKGTIALAALLLFASCKSNDKEIAPASIAQDKEIETKVEKVLKSLSTEQKAGQMIQLTLDVLTGFSQDIKQDNLDQIIGKYKVGSILNVCSTAPSAAHMAEIVRQIQDKSMEAIGVPCLYGLDMIHGASYYAEGTLFPQEINIAATFQPAYAEAMGRAIGYETRAGLVPWTFSPVMDLTRQPAWPRNWESFGEDPYLQSVMASRETVAIQGEDPNHVDTEHCAVSIKHFMAYGAPASGMDRTPAYVAESDLREKYFAPFKACIEAGALTLMVNSAAINGVPTHANYKLLTQWVKEELNWDGMIVTDWADINNLFQRDHVAADRKEALAMGINAGIDMVMEPYDPTAVDDIVALVEEGRISKERLDDAVRRILRLKFRLGLFDAPTWDTSAYEMGRSEFVEASRQAAAESMVLLKNSGVLPLSKDARILLTGPNADAIRCLNGGWTYTWQGSKNESYTGGFSTIRKAMAETFENLKYIPTVVYPQSDNWQDDKSLGFDAALKEAQDCDAIVVCIGENTYCETPGNIQDLALSPLQAELVEELEATGKPVVIVLNEGRPRIIRELVPKAAAIVDALLPGNYGGEALASLLCGDDNFSGKLPFTYPMFANSLHTYDFKVSEQREVMEGMYNYDTVMDVQWPFGAGLSYTSFEYGELKPSTREFKSGDELSFSITVKNTGSRPGKEAVLLYSSDVVASLMPDFRRLRAFEKIELQPGEQKTVTLSVDADDLAFVGADGKWRLEEGDFVIAVGGKNTTVKCTKTKIWDTPNIRK